MGMNKEKKTHSIWRTCPQLLSKSRKILTVHEMLIRDLILHNIILKQAPLTIWASLMAGNMIPPFPYLGHVVYSNQWGFFQLVGHITVVCLSIAHSRHSFNSQFIPTFIFVNKFYKCVSVILKELCFVPWITFNMIITNTYCYKNAWI